MQAAWLMSLRVSGRMLKRVSGVRASDGAIGPCPEVLASRSGMVWSAPNRTSQVHIMWSPPMLRVALWVGSPEESSR